MTSGVDIVFGSGSRFETPVTFGGASNLETSLHLKSRFTLASTKVVEVRQYSLNFNSSGGLGGVTSKFADLCVWKIS